MKLRRTLANIRCATCGAVGHSKERCEQYYGEETYEQTSEEATRRARQRQVQRGTVRSENSDRSGTASHAL
jgi:hypothetical protein